MDNNNTSLENTTAGFGIAAVLAIIVNTLLVWAKESSPALKAAMKAATTHHWITHGLVVLAVFVVLGFMLSRFSFGLRVKTLTTLIVVATVLGGLGLFGWFLFE